MAMPALMFELENPVEERVARLEANIEHIQSDVSDVKVDLRRLNDNLSGKIDAVDQRVSGVKDSVASLALVMEKSFAELKISRALDRVWWL
jgi:archaellum component FlaC